MASSLRLEDRYFRYEVIKKVWMGYLRRHHRGQTSTGESYFNSFIKNHPTFQFSLVKIFDGTKHLMVDREQYEMMKKELEGKTRSSSLPEINSTDLNDPRNVVEEKKVYRNEQQLENHLQELLNDINMAQQRARLEAAEHKGKLCQMLGGKMDTTFLAFDLEVYDRDFTTMLEVGYVKFTLKKGDKPEYFHAIVNEELHNREGFDNKEKFRFGKTERMTLEKAAEKLKIGIAGSDAIVAQSCQNDEKYLAENGIEIEEKPMYDTQVLALDLLPRGPRCWGLKKMLEEMYISYDESILHNAGNDAHYTMLAFKALVKRAMPDQFLDHVIFL